MSLRDLRLRRGWSQEHLAEASGVSVRTIQRIEGGQPPSPFTVGALATALDVAPEAVSGASAHPGVDDRPRGDDDAPHVPAPEVSFPDAVRQAARRWGDFEGRASRSEFWYALLAVLVIVGALAALDERLGAAALTLFLIPLAAVGSRRLRDTAQSPWWLLFVFAPMGFVIPFTLMAMPGKASGTDDS
ncbi:MAG TPA: DUF805 domain-containing protein [Ornithinibacter sp.]|nr:DUF805 domain-containing protein [Ornithinibacter sp.]HOT57944.1 DUF805 domain-containing protein [Ornithinibacter sp.]HPV90235.1 DUF805 domain-containing protein [Ornithinibacter sp.]